MMSNKGMEWSEIKALSLKTPILVVRTNEVEFCEFLRAGFNIGGNFIEVANSLLYDKDDCRFSLTEEESTIRITNKVKVHLMDNQQATAYAAVVAAMKELTKLNENQKYLEYSEK